MSRANAFQSSGGSEYDLIAIGSGPAGQAAAVEAARLGKRAALVERENALGGRAMNAGTLPAQTLRTAVLELTGQAQGVYANPHRLEGEITVEDLFWRTQQVIDHERTVVLDRMRRSSVDILVGTAWFVDPHILEVRAPGTTYRTRSDQFVIAVGTTPVRPPGVNFDGGAVLDGDEILGLDRVPRRLAVVGGGRVGLEYASMAVALGAEVTLFDRRPRILPAVDDDLVEALLYYLRGRGLVLRLGDEVETIGRNADGVALSLSTGERLSSDVVIVAGGRQGATTDLNLGAAGLETDTRGRIAVGPDYRTAQRHIFAAGGVVAGSTGRAATAAEQGRRASLAALGERAESTRSLPPRAIYTIPELSFVGPCERELKGQGLPYVSGVVSYRELPYGRIAGSAAGLFKLLVHADTRELLGVNILGTAATELVHVGQAAIAAGLTVDHLAETVFNVPTYAEGYKLAALDACSRLG